MTSPTPRQPDEAQVEAVAVVASLRKYRQQHPTRRVLLSPNEVGVLLDRLDHLERLIERATP